MADHSVTSSDIAVLRDILDLARPDRPEEPVERTYEILDLLRALLGADWANFQVIDTVHHVRPYCQWNALGPDEPRGFATIEELAVIDATLVEDAVEFWANWWTSPCSLPERTGRAVVVACRDFYSPREWSLDGGDFPVADEMLLGDPIAPGTSARILLGRDEPGASFGHREVTLLTLVQPHLKGLLARTAPAYSPSGPGQLTARQVEILRLVGQGLTNRQVARSVGVTEATVRKHLEHSYTRLGVLSRSAAVFAVFGAGSVA